MVNFLTSTSLAVLALASTALADWDATVRDDVVCTSCTPGDAIWAPDDGDWIKTFCDELLDKCEGDPGKGVQKGFGGPFVGWSPETDDKANCPKDFKQCENAVGATFGGCPGNVVGRSSTIKNGGKEVGALILTGVCLILPGPP